MVKFTRVKDPERAKDGDIVLFPANERRLNVSTRTFTKMGLSVGDTSRSDNYPGTVSTWLARKDLKARAFMLCHAIFRGAPSKNELLLGMDAVAKRAEEDPEIEVASIVPFGPARWTMEQWAAAWNETHDFAVQRRLLATMGLAGSVRANWTTGTESPEDLYAEQVWDGYPICSARPDGADDSSEHFPTRRNAAPDLGTYECGTLMAWNRAGWNAKESRILFRHGFLTELAKRGTVVLRPTGQFVDDMTGQIAGWASAQLAQRFSDRVKACRRYLTGLMADVRRDDMRTRKYRANARKLAPEGARSRRTMLAETGVEL